jgi:GTP cyclohydrolase I
MDAKNSSANIAPWPKQGLSEHVRAAPQPATPRPSREQAENAVRTLIAYAGDDPSREGVLGTPKRVVDAYGEIYQGYRECPVEVLDRTFSETGGYDDFVLVKDIGFNSHCEHHMMPFYGKAHVAYMPVERVVGLSKLARLVDVYAKRMQVQEKMTAEIASCLNGVLKPFGVGVIVEGAHECMTTRGVHKSSVTMVTSRMLGAFRTNVETRQEFLAAIKLKHGPDDGAL